jgi:flagellar biosynthesis/type III secretory pathway M-ring protein FliF/YscJ
VIDQPFQTQPVVAAGFAGGGGAVLQNPQLWQALQIVLIIIAFILLRVFIRRAMVLPTAQVEEVVELPQTSPEEQAAAEIAAEVERLSQEEPETVAALLRTWIAEDD